MSQKKKKFPNMPLSSFWVGHLLLATGSVLKSDLYIQWLPAGHRVCPEERFVYPVTPLEKWVFFFAISCQLERDGGLHLAHLSSGTQSGLDLCRPCASTLCVWKKLFPWYHPPASGSCHLSTSSSTHFPEPWDRVSYWTRSLPCFS